METLGCGVLRDDRWAAGRRAGRRSRRHAVPRRGAPDSSRWPGCSSTTGPPPRTSSRRPSSGWLEAPTGSATRSAPRHTCGRSSSTSRATTTGAGWCPSGTVRRQHRTPPRPRSTRPRARGARRWSRRCGRCPRRQRDCVALRYYLELSIPRHRGNAWCVGELGQDPPAARTAVHGPDPGGEAMSAPEDRFGEAVHDALHDRRRDRSRPLTSSPASSTASTRTGMRRRRRRSVVLLWAAGLALATIAVLTLTPRNAKGVLTMPWWVLELATTAVLIAHRPVARSVHQAVRPRLRRRRLPRQPADREELHRPHRRRVLPDLHGVHPLHRQLRAARRAGGPSSATSRASQPQWEVMRVGGILLIIGDPARSQHRADARAGAAVLPEPTPSPGSIPRRLQSDDPEERSIYRRAAELEREADDDNMR